MSDIRLGKYRHYKGKEYEVIGLSRHSETLEELVVYRALYDDDHFGPNAIWVRPLNLFISNVIVDGQSIPRFKYIPKVYVGCALTQATEGFLQQVEAFKNILRSDFEVLDFVGLEQGTDADVYHHDTHCVRTCDLFVAICDYPAIGLGYELGLALEINKPVIALAHHESKVTRLVLGIDKPNFKFHRYTQLNDMNFVIKEQFK
ncbi:hypothetical protein COT97_05335 [Candidatus Falkowbacteria bacterium CG10_big_fil_rev_8_21_14_0_10_39_11]|uniref:DUF1653 domain-containing protein n=1 Tax=Candidatus Falkowbacteria bacterium CG10_big_fil_rev_8_21_14_0_10_39_11 TaxID=1974565 RepID=A0A2H0V3K4_9BACT|nr:MAG: hypothetical protein COT97_05335 [Candidatus Falkowbacteria bacterium CG10_big_fil_rev_8_21_14_0_10_39_11]